MTAPLATVVQLTPEQEAKHRLHTEVRTLLARAPRSGMGAFWRAFYWGRRGSGIVHRHTIEDLAWIKAAIEREILRVRLGRR